MSQKLFYFGLIVNHFKIEVISVKQSMRKQHIKVIIVRFKNELRRYITEEAQFNSYAFVLCPCQTLPLLPTVFNSTSVTKITLQKCKTPTLKRKKSMSSTDTLLTTVTNDNTPDQTPTRSSPLKVQIDQLTNLIMDLRRGEKFVFVFISSIMQLYFSLRSCTQSVQLIDTSTNNS